jgi:RimJ/RimL family protein N-acetyltransferase
VSPGTVAERVSLRPLSPALAGRIVAGDLAGLRRGRGWPHAGSLVAISTFVATGAGWAFLVETRADGLVVGECGTKGGPGPDGNVEIGYGLAAPVRGRGLGRETVAALVAALADRPEVGSVLAEVDADNTASRRVLSRLGFELVETGDRYLGYRKRL